jgi:hypothetical protein
VPYGRRHPAHLALVSWTVHPYRIRMGFTWGSSALHGGLSFAFQGQARSVGWRGRIDKRPAMKSYPPLADIGTRAVEGSRPRLIKGQAFPANRKPFHLIARTQVYSRAAAAPVATRRWSNLDRRGWGDLVPHPGHNGGLVGDSPPDLPK